MNSPFRTHPQRTLEIGWLACLLGYLMIIPGVPAIAGSVYQIVIWLFKGSGVTHTGAGPTLQTGEFLLMALTYSWLASWMGILVSIPVVFLARAKGWFGWATAALTGAVEAFVLLPLFFGARWDGELLVLCLGGAILGLSFWLVVRVMHPSVWKPDL